MRVWGVYTCVLIHRKSQSRRSDNGVCFSIAAVTRYLHTEGYRVILYTLMCTMCMCGGGTYTALHAPHSIRLPCCMLQKHRYCVEPEVRTDCTAYLCSHCDEISMTKSMDEGIVIIIHRHCVNAVLSFE